jgi:PadR family transcriptional regulator, regulatory protein PadR
MDENGNHTPDTRAAGAGNGARHGGAPENGAGSRDATDASERAAGAKRRTEPQMQPRLWLQPFLLLAVEQWQAHGYELIRRMAVFGFEAIDRASVYRTLRQLERDGLLVSGWDTSKEGPARRMYSLTDAGRDYLELWAASLRGYQAMLNNFFIAYPGIAGSDQQAPAAERTRPHKGGS